jgi:hypothetical protein
MRGRVKPVPGWSVISLERANPLRGLHLGEKSRKFLSTDFSRRHIATL